MKITRFLPSEHPFLERTLEIAKPPKELYVLGTLPAPTTKLVSVIGTRRPTNYGRDITKSIVQGLAQNGIGIISGMAIGVDTIAHTAALEGGGKTFAILPCGLDSPYPKSNHALARRILEEGGALISEYPAGTSPMQYRFLERNRLVSALSDAVIVTEASARSGTLSTVARALEQGKTVFAVPGNITSPMSAGCNQLIKQGAMPLTSVDDVLFELGIDQKSAQLALFGDTDQENRVIDMIKQGIVDGDEILSRSKLSSSEYAEAMTMLEIKGMITPLGGNQWRL